MFWVFGKTQPGIEPQISEPVAKTLIVSFYLFMLEMLTLQIDNFLENFLKFMETFSSHQLIFYLSKKLSLFKWHFMCLNEEKRFF